MKLEGIRVIELAQFLPGPHLTMMMADHGAEVIKIEPPSGEPNRNIGVHQAGCSVFFRNTHRGKQSVVLDLKDPLGREALLRMAENADVVVESFRPGTVKRLGVDYAAVNARNSRIVYCSIAAFGQTGPLAAKLKRRFATFRGREDGPRQPFAIAGVSCRSGGFYFRIKFH